MGTGFQDQCLHCSSAQTKRCCQPTREYCFVREGSLAFPKVLQVGYFLWSLVFSWEGWLRECQFERLFVERALSLSGNVAWVCPDDTCILRGTVCEHIGQQGNMGLWFLHVLLLGEVVLWMMRELENSRGQRAENFSCVHSVSQPSIHELVLAGGAVCHLRDCHNWALMVIYPCTVWLEKCQMGKKCFQTRIQQWWLCDIAVGLCTQVEKSLPRHCQGSLEAKMRLLLRPLAADGKDPCVLSANSMEGDT